MTACNAGRRLWFERMYLAIAMGLIDKFPHVRHGKRYKYWWQARHEAKTMLKQQIAAIPHNPKPFDHQSDAEQHETLTRMALKKQHQILAIKLPEHDDPNYGRVMAIQVELSNHIVKTRLRIDEAALREHNVDRVAAALETIARLQQAEREIKSPRAVEETAQR